MLYIAAPLKMKFTVVFLLLALLRSTWALSISSTKSRGLESNDLQATTERECELGKLKNTLLLDVALKCRETHISY